MSIWYFCISKDAFWIMYCTSHVSKMQCSVYLVIWLNVFLKFLWMIFFVFGDSFDDCLTNLEKVLSRCEEKNLVLNWEKCHFMVTNGIVLGHICCYHCLILTLIFYLKVLINFFFFIIIIISSSSSSSSSSTTTTTTISIITIIIVVVVVVVVVYNLYN